MDALTWFTKLLNDTASLLSTTVEKIFGISSSILNVKGISLFFTDSFSLLIYFISTIITLWSISMIVILFYSMTMSLKGETPIDKIRMFIETAYNSYAAYFRLSLFLLRLTIYPLEVLINLLGRVI